VSAETIEPVECLAAYREAVRVMSSGRPLSGGSRVPRIGRRGVGRPVGQLRGVLAERVFVSTELDPYLALRALAAYSGVSVRKLRDVLADPAHPLPHYRIGGKVVVRRSEYDTWAARLRRVGSQDAGRIADEVVKALKC
jgi:hypothetical protein